MTRPLKLYKSYNFIDKDPVIDRVRTVVEDSKYTYARVEDLSGVTTTTLRNWFFGKTRRPQFATVAAVIRACGQELSVAGRPIRARPNGHLKLVAQGAKTAKRRKAS